ncbi:MAG: tRNA (adenosine(37)-N6)-dimethylallyltransferase MiaA [Clostridia bacterium]|nr:tRNA (adenosine(37)-N6)-dimethylallyltransferase MiaA [Clostridia bacterium]
MSEPKKPLLVVAGPTASGKTSLAIELAKRLNGEVVSADSMQIYQGIQIASTCPTMEERDGIVHHLLEFVPLSTSYSVAQYAEDARAIIEDIHARGKIPVLCGGTGLYIDAIVGNVRYEEQDNDRAVAVRERLKAEWEKHGDEYMWERLRDADPTLAEKLHIHDRGRVMRGIEVFELTGETMSSQQERQKALASPYETTMILLEFEQRERLYERIDRRVDVMMKNGLLEETAAVVRVTGPTADQAIGCKELRPYFNGECSLSEALESMKRRSRQYAKRQLSWFRHRIDPRVKAVRVNVDAFQTVEALCDHLIEDGLL